MATDENTTAQREVVFKILEDGRIAGMKKKLGGITDKELMNRSLKLMSSAIDAIERGQDSLVLDDPGFQILKTKNTSNKSTTSPGLFDIFVDTVSKVFK